MQPATGPRNRGAAGSVCIEATEACLPHLTIEILVRAEYLDASCIQILGAVFPGLFQVAPPLS